MAMIAAGHLYGRYPLGKKRSSHGSCYAAHRLGELARDSAEERVEERRFTPTTQYGVCARCQKRGVTFELPTGHKFCERCFKEEGWALVHEGPNRGWHKKDGTSELKAC